MNAFAMSLGTIRFIYGDEISRLYEGSSTYDINRYVVNTYPPNYVSMIRVGTGYTLRTYEYIPIMYVCRHLIVYIYVDDRALKILIL